MEIVPFVIWNDFKWQNKAKNAWKDNTQAADQQSIMCVKEFLPMVSDFTIAIHDMNEHSLSSFYFSRRRIRNDRRFDDGRKNQRQRKFLYVDVNGWKKKLNKNDKWRRKYWWTKSFGISTSNWKWKWENFITNKCIQIDFVFRLSFRWRNWTTKPKRVSGTTLHAISIRYVKMDVTISIEKFSVQSLDKTVFFFHDFRLFSMIYFFFV